jgi:hypothetical protein
LAISVQSEDLALPDAEGHVVEHDLLPVCLARPVTETAVRVAFSIGVFMRLMLQP